MTSSTTGAPASGRDDDRGSIAVELALGVPMAVLLIFLLVGAFNVGRATIDVNSAAGAASRSASLARTAPAAAAAAHGSATANLSDRCARMSVTVDTSQFRRGGTVTVEVRCTVTTHGLLGIGLPGSLTMTAASSSPLDRYRADT
ncbi:TadE family protein [Actinoplanes aureus]|uniref:TadE family protein n=1 Tax=Actinoplanes aureus TaxID=2792083 RepID=A0A931CL31_9ACTN|nr:TadE family protein [Actinoplanes aureus]MBG0569001.1 TadE family protein [Actinoplanes aureus]